MLDWVIKLYENLTKTTGINKHKSVYNPGRQQLSFNESSITGNSGCDSAQQYGVPNLLQNLTTLTTIRDKGSPRKNNSDIKRLKEDKEALLQILQF